LEPSELLYAVGQGALAVECRVNDSYVLDILSQLCELKTQCRILVERSFLKTLGGGCSAPVAVDSVIQESEDSREITLKVDGAVWSLNGQQEIIDKVSCNLSLGNATKRIVAIVESDESSNEVSPSKKQKLSDDEATNGKKSPKVIDDSEVPCTAAAKKNISEIVDIHGKVFDVCPFSGKKRSDLSLQNPEFDMPIGQDFMGECPVLNIEQKINFDATTAACGDVPAKCPIGKTLLQSEIDKCPFLHNKSEAVELIDYEANNADKQPKELKSLIANVRNDIALYCGLYCHDEQSRHIFEKCEQLGISLADKLILAGALEVMKVAQNEIHSKS